MSDIEIPVTDAFNDPLPLVSRDIELTPRQIEWLQEEADRRGVSLDHVVRSLITAEIAKTVDAPRGDGSSQPPPSSPSPNHNDSTESDTDAPRGEDSPNLMQSLRSAHRRLNELTDEQTVEPSSYREARSRLQAQLDRAAAASSESTTDEDATGEGSNRPSMFDMMDDE